MLRIKLAVSYPFTLNARRDGKRADYEIFQSKSLFSLRRARRLTILLMDMRELSSAGGSLKEEKLRDHSRSFVVLECQNIKMTSRSLRNSVTN